MSRQKWADEILPDMKQQVEAGKLEPSIARAAEYYKVPYEKFRRAMKRRGVTSATLEAIAPPEGVTAEFDEGRVISAANIGRTTIKNDEGGTEAFVVSLCPKTPEEMAAEIGLDLSKYKVVSFESFSREVFVKDLEKDLTFDEGRISGWIRDRGDMVVKLVWSLRARFEPKVIEPTKVMLRPVVIDPPPDSRAIARLPGGDDRPWTTLIVPDAQIGFRRLRSGKLDPFHDRAALQAVIALTAAGNFDEVAYLGDLMDFGEFTDRFLVESLMMQTTQEALNEAASFLWAMRNSAPSALMEYIEGNHEKRFRDLKEKMTPQGARLTIAGTDEVPDSLAAYLGLSKMKIKWIGDYPNGFVTVGDVKVHHGKKLSAKPGATVVKLLEDSFSQVIGHKHSFEYAERQVENADGSVKTIFALVAGCLCRTDGVVPGSRSNSGWQQGVSVMRTWRDGQTTVQIVPWENGKLYLSGLVIS